MKNKYLLILLCLLPALSYGQIRSAGIALGNPTGLNGQYTLAPDKVLDLTLGYELAFGDLEAMLNYFYKKEDAYYLSTYPMDLFYGGGLKVKHGLGVHGSLATSHKLKNQRLELFGALGGTVYLVGRGLLELDVYGGVRYLF